MQDFLFYFGIGWEHIVSMGALDHQLFILALAALYTVRNLKQVLILVTAFTLGHSATLVLSVYDLVRFPSDWVEFLIPCTIVLTALSNTFQKDYSTRNVSLNYYLAAIFGLIHGMGFANSIRMMLASDQHIGWNLLGFNLGLEAGQLAFVALILLANYVVLDRLNVRRKSWVLFLSAAVFGVALKMAVERFPA